MQFMQWFLQEQIEEVALMTTLVRVADRAVANLFDLENFVHPAGGHLSPN